MQRREQTEASGELCRIAAMVSVEAVAMSPWPYNDRFIVGFQYDVTNKPSGQRMKLDEAALYTVRNGKIVREGFFYDMG